MPKLKSYDDRSDQLHGIMVSRGITTEQLAKRLKKPKSTVTYQLRNADRMPINVLMAYANALSMTEMELLGVLYGKK